MLVVNLHVGSMPAFALTDGNIHMPLYQQPCTSSRNQEWNCESAVLDMQLRSKLFQQCLRSSSAVRVKQTFRVSIYQTMLKVASFLDTKGVSQKLRGNTLRNTERTKLIFHVLMKVIGASQVCSLREANMEGLDQLRLCVSSKCQLAQGSDWLKSKQNSRMLETSLSDESGSDQEQCDAAWPRSVSTRRFWHVVHIKGSKIESWIHWEGRWGQLNQYRSIEHLRVAD